MDYLTFVSSLVSSLAWPSAAVALALIIRNPLRTLIPLLRKVKYGDLEAEFELEAKLDDAERKRVVVESTKTEAMELSPPAEEVYSDKFYKLIKESPSLAIKDLYLDLDKAIALAAERVGTPPTMLGRASDVALALFQAGHMTAEQLQTLSAIQELRNIAGHSSASVSENSALRFARITYPLLREIQAIQPKSKS